MVFNSCRPVWLAYAKGCSLISVFFYNILIQISTKELSSWPQKPFCHEVSWQAESRVPLSSVQILFFSHSVVSDSLRPHGRQHARLPCPSPSPRVCSNSCPLTQWCHPIIPFSVAPFFSCPQSFPVSGYLTLSRLSTSGGQSLGASASASVLPVNIQGWFPSGWTGLISLLSKGLSRAFPNTTIWKHQFFGISSQPSLWSNSHIHTSGKTMALTMQAFVGKVMFLLFNPLSWFVIAFLPRSKHPI